jgi:hypothetical protein
MVANPVRTEGEPTPGRSGGAIKYLNLLDAMDKSKDH